MPAASVSGLPSVSGVLWAQIQQQQAQRTAEQAEQRARSLQQQARSAQSDADRAQERARSLQVESNSARSKAGEAKRNLASLDSLQGLQAQFDDMRRQISQVLQPASPTLAPVTNALGQETGTLVNVTA
ncbi:MAG: hypothetical protein ACK4FP_04005 [Azonexus sp.]